MSILKLQTLKPRASQLRAAGTMSATSSAADCASCCPAN